jgi:predicted TIM-barrel fold metal-dependent hydrolase
VALAQAEAALGQTVRQVRTLYANNASYAAQIRLRQADADKARPQLRSAEQDLARRQSLTGGGAISGEELEHARDQVTAAQSALAAARAAVTAAREQLASNRALTDGTLAGLLASMDAAGIEKSVLCLIATKPAQFTTIFNWATAIRSQRLIPFPSLHPRDEHLLAHLGQVIDAQFGGIKMHSYYQDYDLDDPSLDAFHGLLAEAGLILVIHAGFDFSFARIRRADPLRIAKTCRRFPKLKMIATHMGGWEDWQEVEKHLLGQPIYLETSLAFDSLPPERLRKMLLAHPADYLLFGSDSPWVGQKESLEKLAALDLPPELFTKITRGNALRLLGLVE